ncbi:MAG TPA: sigma factor-like helix-turn-helix DNA-binding protein [Streptosporangiaceae bacterium]|nr:sigma factor-like helix-turn-helix DNA-binding protein [Streptosporangiaceae bacterium]
MPALPGGRHRHRRSRDLAAAHPAGRPEAAGTADRAVTTLYHAHYQSLARIATLLVSDTVTAEDIVQAAFVSLHGAWRHLADEDQALAYLRRAVVTGARAPHPARAGSASPPPDGVPAPGPGRSTPEAFLMAALRTLPTRQREALILRYYAEWPDAQIAAAMGISARALASQLVRGMSVLRAKSGRGCAGPPPDPPGGPPARPSDG